MEAERPSVTVEDAPERGDAVLPDYAFKRGDAAAAIAAAPRRLSGVFRIGGQEHFYLEGQIALAIPGEDGSIHVHSSTQHPTEVQHVCARVLGLPDALVTCEIRRMGGGFGGKESQATPWAAIAALAAFRTGRACKLRLDRDEDMAMTGKRHDFRVDWSVGFDEDGRILAADLGYLARCGCSADLSQGVVDRTMFHSDNAYFLPEADHRHAPAEDATPSPTPPSAASAARRACWRSSASSTPSPGTSGRDPLDIRMAQFLRRRTATSRPTACRSRISTRCTPSSTSWSARATTAAGGRRSRPSTPTSPILKRGIALTPVKFGISFTLTHLNQAGALVHVYQDGSVQLNHGGTEMGQGLYQKVAQVVAEEFGIGMERVRITATTTDKVPNTAPTAASAGSDLNGMAAASRRA